MASRTEVLAVTTAAAAAGFAACWLLNRRREEQSLSGSQKPEVEPTSLAEVERIGRTRIAPHVLQYYGYHCGEGLTYRAIASTFDALTLMPRALAGVSKASIDTSCHWLGTHMSSPVLLAPTAFHTLAHDDGELATARAAAAAGTCMVYSFMLATVGADEIAAKAGAGPRWAHLYILKVRARGRGTPPFQCVSPSPPHNVIRIPGIHCPPPPL
jgi:hypothetical protein